MTTSNCFFDNLPEEVLTSILSFLDIPSLGSLTNSHKARDGNISHLASDDTIWFALIRSRFGIGRDNRRRRRRQAGGVVVMKKGGCLPMLCSAPHGSLSAILVKKSSLSTEQQDQQHKPDMNYGRRRPASYGGRDWKSAYRSLSETNRIPETYLTGSALGNGGIFASKSRSNNNGCRPADYLGVWCLVNHAENCRTKTVVPPHTYRTDRRYIELKICLQNIKSGYGCIIPDVNLIRIQSYCEEVESLQGGLEDDRLGVGNNEMIFNIVKTGPWAPRIALRRTAFGDAEYDEDVIVQRPWSTEGGIRSVILYPFEVVVLSVHVSCPETHVYETDALSSMSYLRVPVMSDWSRGVGGAAGCHQPSPLNDRARDVSIARFLTEDELWEYYYLLPGGCMSLTDRSRLVPM